ncbi:MAG TPA: MmcQ/YjbR family DNA-binding protein [Armatimonadota bacterium]|nr:MmcQ/YjbR family DNA-binding protein [Armatimonadota bacterium]
MQEESAIERLREICLALPDAVEKPFGGHTAPCFRVRDKLFVMVGEEQKTVTFKAGQGVQQALVESEPDRFFIPAYVGHKGWVGARLDVDHDWEEIAELVEESYRLIAPRSLSARIPEP